MCIMLSQYRKHVRVEGTRLFARLSGRGTQYLVYSMTVGLKRDDPVAMVLPLPVSERTDEGVRWVDLSEYPKLFSDLEHGYELRTRSVSLGSLAGGIREKLKVHEVGSFVASFVPTPHDFDRLDEAFRVPQIIFDRYPEYEDYGFAVFQLSPVTTGGPVGKRNGDESEVHPMAFEFRSRTADRIFFPTVHFHGDKLEDMAAFDHTYYWQGFQIEPTKVLGPGFPTHEPAAHFVDADLTGGVVDPESRVWKATQVGRFPNRDTIIQRRGSVETPAEL